MRENWRPRPGDRVVRHPRQDEVGPVRLTLRPPRVRSRFVASPLIIPLIFVGFIIIGTLLLLLPFTHHGGGFTPLITALFTATSAITVTGLVVEGTGTYWTRAGQVIILAMIYVGGLGFMTFATFFLILIGHRITLVQRLIVRESLGVNQLGGLIQITVGIVLVSASIQALGFLALFLRFYFLYPPAEAVWQAAFHSVSGFNNAGFSVLTAPGEFIAFGSDRYILLTLATLAFLGGISYWVIMDLVKVRSFSLLTLNTKLVLVVTLPLLALGTAVFLALEYQNPQTLGPLPVEEKVLDAFFQSAMSRTTGFSSVDMGATHDQTNFFITGLMFIGGASASVAGGLKVNTLAVIIVGVFSALRGRGHTSAFGREIPRGQVLRAMFIGVISIGFVFVMMLLLNFSAPGFQFLDLLFEGVSAFATVGLSTGLTPELSVFGKLILVATMFLGRLGPLTLGLALAQRTEKDLYRFPQERVTMG